MAARHVCVQKMPADDEVAGANLLTVALRLFFLDGLVEEAPKQVGSKLSGYWVALKGPLPRPESALLPPAPDGSVNPPLRFFQHYFAIPCCRSR